MFVILHVVAVGTSRLQSSICATTPPATAQCKEQTRNKTDTAPHNKVLLLVNVTKRGVMQSVIMTYLIMSIITLFIGTLDYPNVFARSQRTWIIEVKLYKELSTISAVIFSTKSEFCS